MVNHFRAKKSHHVLCLKGAEGMCWQLAVLSFINMVYRFCTTATLLFHENKNNPGVSAPEEGLDGWGGNILRFSTNTIQNQRINTVLPICSFVRWLTSHHSTCLPWVHNLAYAPTKILTRPMQTHLFYVKGSDSLGEIAVKQCWIGWTLSSSKLSLWQFFPLCTAKFRLETNWLSQLCNFF